MLPFTGENALEYNYFGTRTTGGLQEKNLPSGSLVLERYNAGHIGFAHVLGGRRVQTSSWMWDKFVDEWPGIASGQPSEFSEFSSFVPLANSQGGATTGEKRPRPLQHKTNPSVIIVHVCRRFCLHLCQSHSAQLNFFLAFSSPHRRSTSLVGYIPSPAGYFSSRCP